MTSPTLAYAKIVHRIAVMVGDSNDADETPDIAYATAGTITLTPTISSVSCAMPDGSTLILAPQKIVCTVDASGNLSYAGNPYVWVVDLGDASVNPTVARDKAAYKVEYSGLKAGTLDFTLTGFSINPRSTVDVNDLGALAPLPAGSPTAIVVGPTGPAGATGATGATGEGVATGGTTGQQLVKASDTDFDTEWADAASGGAGAVDSVNGQTGVVVLDQDDIADGTTGKQYTATEKTKLAGVATGATANSTDAQLRDRSTHTGTQAAATISDFNTAADARISAAAGSTVASLSGGKVPSSQIPAVALTTVQTAAGQAAQLALTTQEGDAVVRTDTNQTYIRNAGASGTMTDFTLLDTPTDAVTSVAGRTGTVVLAKADVGLANVDNTADTAKPVSTAQQTALNLKAPLASPTFTGTVGGVTKSMVGLGSVDNTADTAKPVSTAQQTALDLKADSADVPSALTDMTGTLDDSQNTAGVVMGRVFTSANYTTLARLTSRTDMPFMWLGDASTDSTMVPTNSLSGDVILYNAA